MTIKKGLEKLPSWVLPGSILLLGGILRLIFLGDVPAGLHQDESFVALNSYDLFHEGRDSGGYRFPVYMSSWGDGQSAMYSWLLLLLLNVTGGEMSAFLCRLPQVLVGTFTLFSVYILMKEMFGRYMGLWSVFLLTICPWHVMMSRWALDANMLPGFLIFGLTFFVKGLEKPKYLLLSGVFYGLSLYCYALCWTILPVVLALQTLYAFLYKKIRLSWWAVGGVAILGLLALPLMLFLMVNYEIIPEIALPFLTIPKTAGFRGGEVSLNLAQIKQNVYSAFRLFVYQDTGSPYDIIDKWGMFYDIGRVLILVGVLLLLGNVIRRLVRREHTMEFYIFCSLVGGGITSLTVNVKVHHLNNVFIPLVLCEAYAVVKILGMIKQNWQGIYKLLNLGLCIVYLICLVCFQYDYYTGYKQIVNAYFAQGVEECVEFAWQQCQEKDLSVITAEKGTQWPRLLLYTHTLPSEYYASVTYDVYPAPASFEKDGIRVNTRINYENLNADSVYIIYYTDVPTFEENYELTKFYDWYVAVPK